MAKANIDTSSGTKITVEGTADEIASIVAHIRNQEGSREKSQIVEKKPQHSAGSSTTLVGSVLSLRASGYFNEPRRVLDVEEMLARQALHYPKQSISTCLINRVKKGELGRVRVGKNWAYVKR